MRHDDRRDAMEAADPAESVQLGEPVRAGARWSRERRGVVTALGAVIVVSLALAALSGESILEDRARASDREAVLETVSDFATAVVTIDPSTVDADLEEIAGYTTGELAESLGDSTDEQAALIQQLKIIGEGSVSEAGVQAIGDGRATALVALSAEQTVEESAGGTQEIGYRMKITLIETGDGWKVSAAEFVA